MSHGHEVLVVGAGPSGLLLAGDLARAGVACALVERRSEDSNLTRAFAVHARSLELLDARGLGDELAATGAQVGALRVFGRVEIDLSRLPSRYPYVLITPQYTTEQVLADRARAEGAEIIPNTEVVGLRQDAGGVHVELRDGNGSTQTRTAAYVVGTDGVGSTVRQALDLNFPGKSAVQSVILADVRLGEEPSEVLTVDAAGDGFTFLAPFGDGWYRVIAWNRRRQFPDSAPVDLDDAPSRGRRWAPTTACTTRDGCHVSTATNDRSRPTESAACSWRGTPRMCTPPQEVRV